MNVKQSSADNVWKLICHLIFPKILKSSQKNRYTVYYSITIFYKNYNLQKYLANFPNFTDIPAHSLVK